nr:uncharacterized protein LOC111427514 [Onthophagus taurus]
MKSFIIIAALIVYVAASHGHHTPENVERMKKIATECEETTHVDHEKIVQLRLKHFDDTDEHLKDYMHCCFKKMTWMDNDGHLKKDEIKTHLKEIMTDIGPMKECMNKHGSTHAATAYAVYKCLLEHMPHDVKYPL